jgi:3-hydroxybutyryl-CoA dehydrogenase
MKILCIGAGLMGSQVGVEYALGGHIVKFLIRRPQPAQRRIDEAFATAERHRLASPSDVALASRRTSVLQSADHIERDTDLVVESIPEDFDLKVTVLSAVANVASEAVIASNTSSFSIGDLGAAIGAADRTVGTHYLNPPLLTSLVEVIAGRDTAPGSIQLVVDTLSGFGKRPVTVAREVPGFAWNRLQFALLREALWLVEQGILDPETVDTVVQHGLAQRWRHVPPLKSVALGGVETFITASSVVLPTLSDAHRLEGLREVSRLDQDEIENLLAIRDAALADDRRRELGLP